MSYRTAIFLINTGGLLTFAYLIGHAVGGW